MPKPTVQQQRQQYYLEANELLIQRIYASVNDQIAQKRWEFQHSDMDPNRLWNIANQVEALNWVSKKLSGILRQYKPVPDSSVKSLIASLMRVLVRIDKGLLKFKTDKQKSYEYYRLKSRAAMVEWSLFQIHFMAADVLRRVPRPDGIQDFTSI
jgi:tRNA splicing endonuclease